MFTEGIVYMNLLLKELKLRELPEYLVFNSRAGSNSAAEQELVERLKNLPENAAKFDLPLPGSSEEKTSARINRFRQLAEQARPEPEEITMIESTEAGEDEGVEPAAGQIWSVKRFIGSFHELDVLPIARPQYIFLLTNPANLMGEGTAGLQYPRSFTDDRFLEFLPVSIHTEFANQYDVLFPSGNHILGVEFMIETEINSVCLLHDLDRCFGTVTEEEAEKILNTYFFAHKMGHDSELYSVTETGSDTHPVDSVFNQYKEIEFENAQIIAEPVEKLRMRLDEQMAVLQEKLHKAVRINLILSLIQAQTRKAAAATNNVDVAASKPGLVQEIHKDENLLIAVNRYDTLGYYFNIIVASEICDDLFDFKVSNAGNDSLVIERKGRKPGEYFFEFDSEMKSGVYDLSIIAGSMTLFEAPILLEIE